MTPSEDRRAAELLAEAEIGEQARNFLASDLGRCILGIADQDAQAAMLELSEVIARDPTDVKNITRLNNEIILNRIFEARLKELFHKGEQAIGVWRHEHQTD